MLEYVSDLGLKWRRGRVRRKTTDHIQLHHTVGNYGTPARWRALHQSRYDAGNKGVSYSYLVLKDGSVYAGREHEYAHGAVRDDRTRNEQGVGANQRSISIALDGDMRKANLPTDAQLHTARRLINDLRGLYGISASQVLGHNEVPLYSGGRLTGKLYPTLCPCVSMDELRAYLDAPTGFPAQYSYTGASWCNIREKPKSGRVIGRFSRGESITVLDVIAGWAEVKMADGGVGWCTARWMERIDEVTE